MNATQDKKPAKKKNSDLPAAPCPRGEKPELYPSLLKTAAQSGWLTEAEFLTRHTDKEQHTVRELYRQHATAKKATAADLTKTLPNQVGSDG